MCLIRGWKGWEKNRTMEKVGETEYQLGPDDIRMYLKNREPLLFVENVLVRPGKRAFMVRRFPEDEWYFACHFPGNPMVPGVFQLETLFQTAALAIKVLEGYRNKTTNIVRIDRASYRRHILPGDVVTVTAEILKFRHGIAEVDGTIRIGDVPCCEARFVLAVLDDMPDIGGRCERSGTMDRQERGSV